MIERMREDRRVLSQIWREDYSPRAKKVVFTLLISGLAFLWMYLVVNLHHTGGPLAWVVFEATARLLVACMAISIALVFEYVGIGVCMHCC